MSRFHHFLILLLVVPAMMLSLPACNDDTTDEETATCSDGIQNQGELDVDCGGPCPDCDTMGMVAEIGGYNWVASNISCTYAGGKLTLKADNAVTPLYYVTLVYDGAAEPGTYSLDDQSGLTQMGLPPYPFKSGTLVITKFNQSNKTVSGTFSMKLNTSINVDVKKGEFKLIPYN